MNYTTKITTLFDEDAQQLMSSEYYSVFSNDGFPIFRQEEANYLLSVFAKLKLNRYYDCIEKAKRAAKYFNIKNIHLGSLMVESTENNVSYGYLYKPPL